MKIPNKETRHDLLLALLGGGACLLVMFGFMCFLAVAVGNLGSIRGLT